MTAKMIGESLSFAIGYTLSPYLKEYVRKYKIYRAIERTSTDSPIMFAFFIRANGYTGPLITNYGQGILRTVEYRYFLLFSFLIALPHVMLAVFLGRELDSIECNFNSLFL